MTQSTAHASSSDAAMLKAILDVVGQDEIHSPGFDAGIARIQSLLGQDAGDVAGQVFTGKEEAWRHRDKGWRLELISTYLVAELDEVVSKHC